MTDYYYSSISFEKDEKGFKHNLDGDFACFTLWKSARPYFNKIRDLLSSRFEILLETEIEWSRKNFHENAERLYESPVYREKSNSSLHSKHAIKIGDTKFILLIVRDKNPRYTYAKSVSGKIELSNLNIVEAKYTMRNWIQNDTGVKFGIHSTNSIYEFFFQAPLFLGIEMFKELLNGKKQTISKIKKDLEGADGWQNWKEVFDILNVTNNYLVLRSFETLPELYVEKDLDVLTENYQLFASALGVKQRKDFPYKGTIQVNNEQIDIDMRFVGDNYFNTSWAKDILQTKTLKDGIFIPRVDHYFFTLLYHAKVQKPRVKEKYYGILDSTAKSLGFCWYNTSLLDDDDEIGRLLRGFYESNGFYYEDPVDKKVYKNKEIIRLLPTKEKFSETSSLGAKARLKRILPKKIADFLYKLKKKIAS